MSSRNDSLFAADTPIAVDPELGSAKPPARSRYASREEMIARLVAAGHTPEDAARIVDSEVARSGPRPRAMFDADNTPQGNAALAERVQRGNRTSDRQARFESHYNEVTGAPGVPAAQGGSYVPPPMDEEDIPRTPDDLRSIGQNPYSEPGPNMPDGTKAAGPRQLQTRREARAYNTREGTMPATDPSEPGGSERYKPSQRDLDMAARGYVPVYNDDGTVSYKLSPGTGVRGLPGSLGRGGQRNDLEGAMRDENGNTIQIGTDANGNPIFAPKFVTGDANGPTGPQTVYKPSELTQRRNNAYQAERRLYRMSQQAGVSPAEFRAAHPELFTDMEVPVGPSGKAPQPVTGQFIAQQGGAASETPASKPQFVRSGVSARMAVQGARQSKAQEREDAWRSQMMLAGSNGRKNAVNAYNQLGDPSVSDWQKAVMANMLSPDMDNTTPLTVDAMGAQNALRFLNSTNLGAAGLGGPAGQIAVKTYEAGEDAKAADYAIEVANNMGFDTNGNSWFRSPPTPEDRRRIERRVEAKYPGRGARAVAGLPEAPAPSLPPPQPVGSAGAW